MARRNKFQPGLGVELSRKASPRAACNWRGVSNYGGGACALKKIKPAHTVPTAAQISVLQSTGVWIAGFASAFLAHEAYIPVPSLCW